MAKYVYICDGRGCDQMCANMTQEEKDSKNIMCHHTFDEKHCANKVRRSRKFVQDEDGNMVEIK